MKLSILTTITNPEARQDKWREALDCYQDLADEVIVVCGFQGDMELGFGGKVTAVYQDWPSEWNWVELPRHLNFGKKYCTGDWILKLDIDQLIHEKDFDSLRETLKGTPDEYKIATFQKMSMTYGGKYYQKGEQLIAFKNEDSIAIGENLQLKTDLCFAVKQTGTKYVGGYNLPVGLNLESFKTGISYWNYDYFFKTKDFTRKEFWRFSQAHHKYFGGWQFGSTEEDALAMFLTMQKGRYDRASYTATLETHPRYIREAVKNLTEDQFGKSGWGIL